MYVLETIEEHFFPGAHVSLSPCELLLNRMPEGTLGFPQCVAQTNHGENEGCGEVTKELQHEFLDRRCLLSFVFSQRCASALAQQRIPPDPPPVPLALLPPSCLTSKPSLLIQIPPSFQKPHTPRPHSKYLVYSSSLAMGLMMAQKSLHSVVSLWFSTR